MADVSKIQIWNQALGYIGTRRVASDAENCEEARQCALYWDSARQQALRDFPFPWAQHRAMLAQKKLPDVWAADWRFAYGLPQSCLKVHRIGSASRRDLRAPFKMVHDPAGTVLILTDADAAFADYTSDVESPTLWDADFIHMLARKLAAMIAIPLLKNNGSKVSELEQLYRAAIPQAYQPAAQEQKSTPQEDSWISCR